jgi:alginate O-acetyltransferase complex protein AlgI
MLFPTMVFGIFFLVVFFTAWSLDRENGRRKAFLAGGTGASSAC